MVSVATTQLCHSKKAAERMGLAVIPQNFLSKNRQWARCGHQFKELEDDYWLFADETVLPSQAGGSLRNN